MKRKRGGGAIERVQIPGEGGGGGWRKSNKKLIKEAVGEVPVNI